MMTWLTKRKPALFLLVGLAAGLLVGVGMMVGTLVAVSQQPQIVFPERPVYASATHGASKFAMATGKVGDDTEGVFMLDYLTGDLQCLVIYPRTGTFRARFVANVVRDLAGNATAVRGKEPNYLMVTGQTDFQNRNVGRCVVYVADANTGNYVAYGMPWNRNAINNGELQQANLTVIGKGTARNVRIRNN